MKKFKNYALTILVAILFITGCSSDKGDVVKTAEKNLQDAKNYAVEFGLQIGANVMGMTMEIPMTMNLDVDVKNNTAYGKTNVFGMESEAYFKIDGDKTISYTKSDEEWQKSEEVDLSVKEIEGLAKFSDLAKSTKEEKSDDKDVTHYVLTIDKDKFVEVMDKLESLNDLQEEEIKFKEDIKVSYYINKKDKTINRIYIDLTNVIDMKSEDGEETPITKFIIDMKFSKLNKVGEINIPQEVIDNAVEDEDYDFDFNFDSDDLDFE